MVGSSKEKEKKEITMVNIMARPKKNPTKVVRIDRSIILRAEKIAKKRKMSLPDYLAQRLSK